MLFNSVEFLLFFPTVLLFYFLLPNKFRWALLLLASYVFYMAWKPVYILLIIGSTLIDYVASIYMEKAHQKNKKWFLFLSLFVNLGVLFLFKYFGLFTDTFNYLTGANFNGLALILPMGISFYTFQTLSYTIDVYKGTRKAERHLGYFALYVTYFPQLVAGPIERSDRLLPQLKVENKFEKKRAVSGAQKMLWGFFKKIVIADNLAAIINPVFSNVEGYSGVALLVSTILFGIQIYCDFSAYSDIAIGTAKIMGVELMENFKRPYVARSIKEFWSRWHISLSTWFRDYVYIPLGGSKKGPYRTYFNVLIVFLVSGLWHGADWKFVVWGGIHAVYQMYEGLTYKLRKRIWQKLKLDGTFIQSFVKWFVTMVVVFFAWVFFRANSMSDALYIINQIFNNFGGFSTLANVFTAEYLIVGLIGTAIITINHYLEEIKKLNVFTIFNKYTWLRWGVYYTLIFIILIYGFYGEAEFIYFQF